MNPLTNVKNVNKMNQRELELGLAGTSTSWHAQYKESAWIFIGGLPYDLSEGDVLCIFSQYGEIVNINMVRDPKTGKPRGFCFICYEDQRSTILAVDNLNGIKVLNRTLRVDHVKDYKPPKEKEEMDELTKKIREEGCAPKVRESESEAEEEDEGATLKKTKKEKKKKKKRKKDKRKHSSESDSESSDSEKSSNKQMKIKQEKKDGVDTDQTKLPRAYRLPDYDQQISGRIKPKQEVTDKRESHRDREYDREKIRDKNRDGDRDRYKNKDRDGSRNGDGKTSTDGKSWKHRDHGSLRDPDRSGDRKRDRSQDQVRHRSRDRSRERSDHKKDRYDDQSRSRYNDRRQKDYR